MEAQQQFSKQARELWLNPQFSVHTVHLLEEITRHSGQPIYEIPMRIFGQLLYRVGQRAAEINDPKMNALMCMLGIYTVAVPDSPDFDREVVQRVKEAAAKMEDGI